MAKTRKSKKKRGGAVEDGQYVYGLFRWNRENGRPRIENTVYKHLESALDSARIPPNDEPPYRRPKITELKDINFNDPTQLIRVLHEDGMRGVYIKRMKLSEQVPEAMKPEQKAALNDLGKQKAIPDELQKMIGDYANLERRV